MAKKRVFRKLRFKLPKFVRGKNGAAIFLGVTLAIAASFYVVSAKYSAGAKDPFTSTNQKVKFTVVVKDIDGKLAPKKRVEIKTASAAKKGTLRVDQFTTNSNGQIQFEMLICQQGKKKKLCAYPTATPKLELVSKATAVVKENVGDKVISNTKYFSGTTTHDAGFTLNIKKSSAGSSATTPKGEIKLTAKIVQADGKTVVPDKTVKFNFYGTGGSVSFSREAKTSTDGLASLNVKVEDNKILSDTNEIISKVVPTVWEGGNRISESKKYFPGKIKKDTVRTVKLTKEASANNKTTKTADAKTYDGKVAMISVRVKDEKDAGAKDQRVQIIGYYKDSKGAVQPPYKFPENKTGSAGFANIDLRLCVDGKGYYVCTTNPELRLRVYKIGAYVIDSKGNKGKEKPISLGYPIAKNDAELFRIFEKRTTGDAGINLHTIILSTDLKKAGKVEIKSGSSSSAGTKPASSGSTKKAGVVSTVVERVKYSEELPPASVSGAEKSLQIKLYDSSDKKKPVRGPVKITTLLKECTKNGCGGATGNNYKKEEAQYTADNNGVFTIKFGAVNVKQIKKGLVSGKTTEINRYFLTSNRGSNYLVREVLISDKDGKNIKKINIGSYPFATNTEAKAKSFKINGGKPYVYYVAGSSNFYAPPSASSNPNDSFQAPPQVSDTTDTKFYAEIKPKSSVLKSSLTSVSTYSQQLMNNAANFSFTDLWNK